ncbi:hypothetical protein AALO_G00252980 [Alosa alosa]|uniref:Uncharacterized protein n=1 Tax=Alosa alosa TaxID=278164 RepID=A0AAV6FS73_9TELE|nr:uncharacterized protein LOC121695708 [Alosa sapidissima]XP_041932708.1 uncharacterized protein LOC121695708 [Alosa sapidissima]XP_048085736.1 uncharacterized protein LOC125285362 [Alosa alosa]XP_048085737.1 uncharacterized protein LOC125285362 [Alosa alosa]KAG5264366.1 hypothetical protein AALO_G00252980 [Alosa alosa]
MGIDSQDPLPPPGNLTRTQAKGFMRSEPITLGSIQILIAVLTLFLGVSLLTPYDLTSQDFITHSIVMLIGAAGLIVSGAILIHTGRRPSLCMVKATLIFHLVSLIFSTTIIALLSNHLPYRQNMYHCEHCSQLELDVAQQHCFKMCTYKIEKPCKYLIDGLLCTIVVFIVLELVICIIAILFGLQVIIRGRAQPPPLLQQTAVTEVQGQSIEDPKSQPQEAVDGGTIAVEVETLPAEPQVDPPPQYKS